MILMKTIKRKNKVIFNWFTPAWVNTPSPALSILKQFLKFQGFESKIIYWNLIFSKMQSDFLWRNVSTYNIDEWDSLMLIYNFLAIRKNDLVSYNYVKTKLMLLKPQNMGLTSDDFDGHMKQFAEKFDLLLDEVIADISSPDILYYGMSVSLYQWIYASVIAEKLKEKDQKNIIVIGGIGTEKSAIAFLENFDQFDYAIWGEGEQPLAVLSKELSKTKIDHEKLINTAYRQDENIIISINRNKDYVDLSTIEVRPDYSDYFEQKKKYEFYNDLKIFMPVESSRGCHWKRCHFCYLHTGYKYRQKSIPKLIEEIELLQELYNPQHFMFLDNDIVGKKQEDFNFLLDHLILIKEKFPDFSVNLAEIITKGIHSSSIRKMSLAGFVSVQIGYESPSNSLLKKIDKKNTFASNLLFIKFATQYKIRVSGANVIRGLLEETDDDIFESIDNLHVMRFFLDRKFFQHNISSLAVMSSSRYYKEVENYLHLWDSNGFTNALPKSFFRNKTLESSIVEVMNNRVNPLWDLFQQVELHYLNNDYTYQLLKKEKSIIYNERLNNEIINTFEFDIESLDWFILLKANDSVVTINDLQIKIENEFKKQILNIELFNVLETLKSVRLIYATDDYSEIVTIVNTSNIL
jgi:radical SAM superfamily enzyme YgiQ (UPF0313 family)